MWSYTRRRSRAAGGLGGGLLSTTLSYGRALEILGPSARYELLHWNGGSGSRALVDANQGQASQNPREVWTREST